MNAAGLPAAPVAGLRPRELGPDDAAPLQRLLEGHPAYYRIVHGQPAGPDEARFVLADVPPPGIAAGRRWPIGYLDEAGEAGAFADVVFDLPATAVCHLGFFIVAPGRQGRGDARAIYRGLEDWARAAGAAWMRLGVVEGNARGERFWRSLGFEQVRTRANARAGHGGQAVVRVMFKPLAGGTRDAYLQHVVRDRPETP